jgi:hypothetical protein
MPNGLEDLVSPNLAEWFEDWLSQFKENCSGDVAELRNLDFTNDEFRELASRPGKPIEALIAFEIIELCNQCIVEKTMEHVSPKKGGGKAAKEISLVSASLSTYIMSNLWAVRSLSLGHNDLPARIIARSVAEASDLWIVLQNDRALAKEWIDAQEDPRAFWHQNLSGKKLSKKRAACLASVFGELGGIGNELSSHFARQASDFSMAVHPSYQAGIMVMFEAIGNFPVDDPSFSGAWLPGRTLKYVVSSVGLALSTFALHGLLQDGFAKSTGFLSSSRPNLSLLVLFKGVTVAAQMSASAFDSDECVKVREALDSHFEHN